MMTWHPDTPDEYKNQIVTGDARELAKRIPDDSVDLIWTDPPYPAEFIHVWNDLGELASRILKPGASLITLLGHYQLPHVLNALSCGELRYHWIGWLIHNQKSTSMAFRTVRGGKPFLWFVKGKGHPIIKHGFYWDTKTGYRDKRYHKWGQGIQPTIKDLLNFTLPGDVILDPFCGGGTVAAAAEQLNRNYIAFEIDPDTAELARKRVREAQPPLFIEQPKQAELGI